MLEPKMCTDCAFVRLVIIYAKNVKRLLAPRHTQVEQSKFVMDFWRFFVAHVLMVRDYNFFLLKILAYINAHLLLPSQRMFLFKFI